MIPILSIKTNKQKTRVGLRADRNECMKVPKSQFIVFPLKAEFKTRLFLD